MKYFTNLGGGEARETVARCEIRVGAGEEKCDVTFTFFVKFKFYTFCWV